MLSLLYINIPESTMVEQSRSDVLGSGVLNSYGEDIVEHILKQILKNGSYTDGSYHQRCYYPQLVRERLLQKLDPEVLRSSQCNQNSSLQPNINSQHSGTGSLPRYCTRCLRRLPSLDEVLGSGNSSIQPRFYLDSVSSMRTDGQNTQPAESSEANPSTSQASQDSASSQCVGSTAGAPLTAGPVRHERSSVDSMASMDSVFTEELMTDEGEGRVVTSARDSEESDSSFSSPRSSSSSSSALELQRPTDRKQDGGGHSVEVVGTAKDKVTSARAPICDFCLRASAVSTVNRLCKPDIRVDINREDPRGEEGQEPGPGRCKQDTGQCTSVPLSEMDPLRRGSTGAMGSSEQLNDSDDDQTSAYEDREFDFLKTEPVRRSTSLKTYKTPPGTPHRKKAVRFADALGLDLESVRHILNVEDPPDVPKSAMEDLKVGLENDHKTEGVKYLSALFSQPSSDPGFMRRVAEGKVALENCVVGDRDLSISGTIRVANISYHKKVLIRYSTNSWLTSDDVIGSYVQDSNDGVTDRFSFNITVPTYFAVGQRLEFAILFSGNDQPEHWDNNYGSNYIVECYARALPTSQSDNTWMHFL